MAQELKQGGYKSLGEALSHYLNPEESNPVSIRRFLGNLSENLKELLGIDEESIIKNLEDRQAALELSATGNRGTFDSNDPNMLHGVSLSGFGEKKRRKERKQSW